HRRSRRRERHRCLVPMPTASTIKSARVYSSWLSTLAKAALPALLFGLRLWAAVCLALYVAFWLQLEDASWAGTSAAIVCQPSVGASLRKGSARMVGTAIGAV